MTWRKDWTTHHAMHGMTLVELMVSLAIGSFLMIGAVQVYNQSRQAFTINESIARVQETAQFAMDTIEADLRMASNWGQLSRASSVNGRSVPGTPNPLGLPVPGACGATWALDLTQPLVGSNNVYTLPCPPNGGAQIGSDIFTIRRTTVAPSPLEAGRLQVQTSRMQGVIFADGLVPGGYDPLTSETHNLVVSSYYVSADSTLIPGAPTLRRKMLVRGANGPEIVDQEVAPGVENMQLLFGVDVNQDNSVDRYVNPGDPILNPGGGGVIPGARVIAVRIWLVVRGVTPETGIEDNFDYNPGDVQLGVFNDDFRRMQVSKTILLRNARS